MSVNIETLEAALKANVPTCTGIEAAITAAKAKAPSTQGDVAIIVIDLTGGLVSKEALTAVLKVCFPSAKIGDRHGAHYLSKARTGKLKVEAAVIPVEGRVVKKPTTAAPPAPAAGAAVVAPPAQTISPTPESVTLPATIDETTTTAPPVTTEVVPEVVEDPFEKMSMKDVVAKAKALGVKAGGNREQIIARIKALES